MKMDIDTFGFQLITTMRAWRRALDEAFAVHGLSEATWRPLIHIHILGEGLHQNRLAASLGIEGPSLVRLLDNLQAAGLIERREDPHDRRAKTLHLTAAGRTLAAGIRLDALGLHERLLDGLDPAAIETCLKVFARVQDNCARMAVPAKRRAGAP
ncbi:MarR family winged helix-turn-helix transcriptional regulator [Zavarzinia compransoris]|uniref:MarR family transcriptional regulator n=1 Tax=Zavarzinia compransoris TaxID=1264899 RepID=A0A317E0H9_9PROT|nr:MarR family transcriptional regulator [Zavarzinia compransoris]PWR18863.1 MarR family transcriptional regulator [Zavarzinia compransoris]TDP48858.1 MarR family transcriptional regulator [Zavarzinia compransoris]